MARGRNQQPSTSNKPPVKNKTTSVAANKEREESSEEITLPRNPRTTRRSLTVVKEQVKYKDNSEINSSATSNAATSRARLRSRSRKSLQSSSDSSNLSLINVDNEATITTSEGTSFINGEEIFLDNINNVASVVEISDFGQISNTLMEGGDSDEKQTISIDDSLGNFETGSFAMSSHDEDSQSQSDCIVDQPDEENSNNIERETVVSTETTDNPIVNQDHEILLEICTDQSVQTINPSLYAFASPPHSIKQNEECANELSLADVNCQQKESSTLTTPISNIKCSLRSRDTPTPDRVVSSPEIIHFRPNTKAPRTYQNKRRTTNNTISTNNKKTVHEMGVTTTSAVKQIQLKSTTSITQSQDKSNMIQDKVLNRQGTPTNVIECRRSQRNRIIKYDVRDLLNKNRKSKIQIESKIVLKPPQRSEPSPTYLIKERSLEGYDTDRSSLLDSPRVFKGFSDSDNSKMSPITIKEKICTSDVNLPLAGDKTTQKKEISIQTMDSKDHKKEIGIELRSNQMCDVMTKLSTSKSERIAKGAQETISNQIKSKIAESCAMDNVSTDAKNVTGKVTSENISTLMEDIIILDENQDIPKKMSKYRSKSVRSMPIRKLRNRIFRASVTTTPPIELLDDETTDEDVLLEAHQDNLKKPTRTQEIFMKCLKRSQQVESLIERNISTTRVGRKNVGNLVKKKFPFKPTSSEADFEKFVGNLTDDSSTDSLLSDNRTTRSRRNLSVSGNNSSSTSETSSVNKSKKKSIENKIEVKTPICEEVGKLQATSVNKTKKKSVENKKDNSSSSCEEVFAKDQDSLPVNKLKKESMENKIEADEEVVVKVQTAPMNKTKKKSVEKKTEQGEKGKQPEVSAKCVEEEDKKNEPGESISIFKVEIKEKPILTKLIDLTEGDSSKKIMSGTSVASNESEDGLNFSMKSSTAKTRSQKRVKKISEDDKSEKSISNSEETNSPQAVDDSKKDQNNVSKIVTETKTSRRSSQRKCSQKGDIALDNKNTSGGIDKVDVEMEKATLSKTEYSSICVSSAVDKSNISEGETYSKTKTLSVEGLGKISKEESDNSENKISLISETAAIEKDKNYTSSRNDKDLPSSLVKLTTTSENLIERKTGISMENLLGGGNDNKKITKMRISRRKSRKEIDSVADLDSSSIPSSSDLQGSTESDVESIDNLSLQERRLNHSKKVKMNSMSRRKSMRVHERTYLNDKNEIETCETVVTSSEESKVEGKKQGSLDVMHCANKDDENVTKMPKTQENADAIYHSDKVDKNLTKSHSLTTKERVETTPIRAIAKEIDDHKNEGKEEALENLKSTKLQNEKKTRNSPKISESNVMDKKSMKIEMDREKNEIECETSKSPKISEAKLIKKKALKCEMKHKKNEAECETHKDPEISGTKLIYKRTTKKEMMDYKTEKSKTECETLQSYENSESKLTNTKSAKGEIDPKNNIPEGLDNLESNFIHKKPIKGEMVDQKVEKSEPEHETLKIAETPEIKLTHKTSSKAEIHSKESGPECKTLKSPKIGESNLNRKSSTGEIIDQTVEKSEPETHRNPDIIETKLALKKSPKGETEHKRSRSERETLKSPKIDESKLVRKSARSEAIGQKIEKSELESETFKSSETPESKLTYKKSAKSEIDPEESKSLKSPKIGESKLMRKSTRCEVIDQKVEKGELEYESLKSSETPECKLTHKKTEMDHKESALEGKTLKSPKTGEPKVMHKSARGEVIDQNVEKGQAEYETVKSPDTSESKLTHKKSVKAEIDHKVSGHESKILKSAQIGESKLMRKSAKDEAIDQKIEKTDADFETLNNPETPEYKVIHKKSAKADMDHKESGLERKTLKSSKIGESKLTRKSTRGEMIDQKVEKNELECGTHRSSEIVESKLTHKKSSKDEIDQKRSGSERETLKSPKIGESKSTRKSARGEIKDPKIEKSEPEFETRRDPEIVESKLIHKMSAKGEIDQKKSVPERETEIAESKLISKKSPKGEIAHKSSGPKSETVKSPKSGESKSTRKSTRVEMIGKKIEKDEPECETRKDSEIIQSKVIHKNSAAGEMDHKKSELECDPIKSAEIVESKLMRKSTKGEMTDQKFEKSELECETGEPEIFESKLIRKKCAKDETVQKNSEPKCETLKSAETPEFKVTHKMSAKSDEKNIEPECEAIQIQNLDIVDTKLLRKSTRSAELMDQKVEKVELECETRKSAEQKCLDFLKTLENDKILETKNEETKKRKSSAESNEIADGSPSTKKFRKTSRAIAKEDSQKTKESDKKVDLAEEIMEIVVGEYTRKIQDSVESSSDNVKGNKIATSKFRQNEDIKSEEKSTKCNIISEEIDQNQGNISDSNKVSSQAVGFSTIIEVVPSSSKTEEIPASKTDEGAASSANVNYSQINDSNKKEKEKASENKMCVVKSKINIDDVTLTDQDFHHLREIFKSKDLVSNLGGKSSSHILAAPPNAGSSGFSQIDEKILDWDNQSINDKIKQRPSAGLVQEQDLKKQIPENMELQDKGEALKQSLECSGITEVLLDCGKKETKISILESENFPAKSKEKSSGEKVKVIDEETEIKNFTEIMEVKEQQQDDLSNKSEELGKSVKDAQKLLSKNLKESQKSSVVPTVSSPIDYQKNENSETAETVVKESISPEAIIITPKTSKPISSDKIKNKQMSSRKAEKDFDKISSKEEKERILHSLYCPQKANVRDTPKNLKANIEKSNETDNNKKDKKFNRQIFSKDESFSNKNIKNKSAKMTTPWQKKEEERSIKEKTEDKKESDKRSSGKCDRTADSEKRESNKGLSNRLKYIERESKWKNEENCDKRSNKEAPKKDQKYPKIDKDKLRESPRDHDSSSRNHSKSDISKKKSQDFPRKDERNRGDTKRRSETTPSRERDSSKSSYKSYEHDAIDSKKPGMGSSVERKNKSISFDEALRHKDSICSTKAVRARFSLDSDKHVIENKEVNSNLRISKEDKNSSFKTSNDVEKIDKGDQTTLENNVNLESVAIKGDHLKNTTNDNSQLQRQPVELKEKENSYSLLTTSEDLKLKDENSTKPDILGLKNKQKLEKPKRSRWDLIKTVDQNENDKQKKHKLDPENPVDCVLNKNIDNSQDDNEGIVLNPNKIQEKDSKSEDRHIEIKSHGFEDAIKSTGVPLSKAALKAYPAGLDLTTSPYHTDVAMISSNTLSHSAPSSALEDGKPEISSDIQFTPENLKEAISLDFHSTLKDIKPEIYPDIRPLPAKDRDKEEETVKQTSVDDNTQKADQDKEPSPKDDSQDSQEDSSNSNGNGNIRRSHRLKTISKIKLSVGRGLVRDKERLIDSDDRSQSYPYASSTDLEAENAKFLKDMEERLSQFNVIKENDYKCERIVSKEAKKMICDCFLTRGEEERGELGCGEDCLNRLLMIECGPKCIVGDRCTNKRFQKNLSAPCKVFRTEKKGFGIMADGDILQGEFIMEYVGEVLNDTQFKKRAELYSHDKNKHYYFMALRSDAIIDATAKGSISRFINHSCDPNAETQKWTVNGELRIGFFSRRNIHPGEEITFDYQFQRYGKEAQKCYCEAENCRGWIGEEPDSEEEDEEISGESEEEEDQEKAKEESILTKEVEQTGQPEGDAMSVSSPLRVPVPIVPMPISSPYQHDQKMEHNDETNAVTKSAWISQERVSAVPKKVKHRKEFRLIKKKMEYLEDPDVEEAIESLNRTGLKNQSHTLLLSRLMVRAKMLGTRVRLLDILRTGEMPCKRLFLDYHGLRLLHGWMNENEIKDIEKDLKVRLLMVQTLEVLPIPNKTMLKESKVYQTIQSWANEKEAQSSSPNDDSPSDSGSGTPIINDEQQNIKKVDKTQVPESAHPIRAEIADISRKLLSSWEELPEVFRIPKRERIEQMKEHEREADRQYKALNLVDEDNERFSRKRRNERFGKASKSTKGKKFKWKKEKKCKEMDKEMDKTDIDPNLTKVQRRQLFAAQVEKDEQEKRERREFDDKCKFYGLDPTKTHPKDLPFCVNPATGQWYSGDKRKIETPPSHAHIQVQVQPKPQSTNSADYHLPKMDLPPLWQYAIDVKGRIYYYHMKIRIPQWEHPIKIEPLSGATEDKSDDPVPSTSRAALEESANPDDDLTSASDSSNDSMPESKMRKIVKLLPDECSVNDDSNNKSAADLLETIREGEISRHSLLVQERAISPRREEDRIYNQIEMRRYKENKEKIRKRREDMKRKKAQIIQEGKSVITTATPSSTTPGKSLDELPLPIQDYLFSSDEEDQLRSDYDDSPLLLEKFVQGDKIVDELDALKKEKPLKRPLPIKDESKKRLKLEERKRITDDSTSTKESKSNQKSGKHTNTKYLARKAKEKFRTDIAGVIVQHLTPYRKDTCQIGRITNNDDFKHLARKLTHFVMLKELKHCDSTGQILEVTESVKNKSREFIKKYMAKYGATYIRPENDREFKDIPQKD